MSSVVTRFAPSPTGFLHIGGARTALFNWLYARHFDGAFLLRIEDTDRQRSSQEATDAIFSSLRWLGLEWDAPPVFQSTRAARHAESARRLLAEGRAYRCYATAEELQEMRETAKREHRRPRYDGRWRDRDPADAPAGVRPVIRLKMPQSGHTMINDRVQGEVVFANSELDDMILLRSDGTPTYLLAVVVDDHDSCVSHVIRGDDHLTNAARQSQICRALGWPEPVYAHIPLIHGPDGGRMSKRHGSISVEQYREQGFLPEAVCNYLMRLGWSHGDNEIFSTDQAIDWFDLPAVGRSAARFDLARLTTVNVQYLKTADDQRLANLTAQLLTDTLGRELISDEIALLAQAMPAMKERNRTLVELANSALFFFQRRPLQYNDKAAKFLIAARGILGDLHSSLNTIGNWTKEELETCVRDVADTRALGLGKVAQPLRAALTGSNVSPPIFDVLYFLGREESLGRLADGIAYSKGNLSGQECD